jgi:hypothetical protein
MVPFHSTWFLNQTHPYRASSALQLILDTKSFSLGQPTDTKIVSMFHMYVWVEVAPAVRPILSILINIDVLTKFTKKNSILDP